MPLNLQLILKVQIISFSYQNYVIKQKITYKKYYAIAISGKIRWNSYYAVCTSLLKTQRALQVNLLIYLLLN